MSTIQLSFLGPAHFSRAGQPIELTSAKAVALLGYLAVTGTPQTREHLVDLLWPESHPDAARQNLRNRLWTIRKAFAEDVLLNEGNRLVLGEGLTIDVALLEAATEPDAGLSLEAMRNAAALWRGPLLDGLNLLDAPDFEIWLTTERERLGQQYLRLLERLVARHRAAGEWAEMVGVARQALAYDNLQEPMVRALMEGHARLGERTDALRQYDLLQSLLHQELGVEPLPETKTLRQDILDGHLLASAPQTINRGAAPPARQPTTARPSHSPSPFVGRAAEQAVLDEALAVAGQGRLQIVLLTGEMGIGKTSLWQRWSARLGREQIALESRCLDTTQGLPFAPLVSMFSRGACMEQLRATLSPVWLSELSRLLPSLREQLPHLPTPASLPPAEERGRLFEAFTQIVLSFKARPLLFFIDDLHWADQATLDWLVYLVERLREEPLLLVAAYRPTEASAHLTQMMARWWREGLVQRLPLARLTLEEATALIAALNAKIDSVEQVYQKSAGNPYFLTELSQTTPHHIPLELAELLRARLERLPDTARQVLQAAAVLETDFDFDLLRRTARRSEEETLDGVDVLLEAGVLNEREARYEFAHPLVAHVVRERLSAARRRFLHRRAAEVLAATQTANLPAVAGQLVTHYSEAHQPEQAAHYAAMAGERALSLTALTEAVAFYEQAYRLAPTPARRLGLGRSLLFMQGRQAEARQMLREALADFEAEGDSAGVVDAALTLAFSYVPTGEGEKIMAWAERALLSLGDISDPAIQARTYQLLGAGGFRTNHSLTTAEANFMTAIELATQHDLSEIGMNSWFELGNLLIQRGDLGRAKAAFDESLAVARNLNNIYQEGLCYNNLAHVSLLLGDVAGATAYVEQGVTFVETHALIMPRQYLYSTQGEIALAMGDLDKAEACFKQATVEAEKFSNRVHVANLLANLGLVARARGDLDRALTLLTTAQQAIAGVSTPHLHIQLHLWLAELHLERGDVPAAEQALAQAEDHLRGSQRQRLQAWAERLRAQLPKS